MAAPLVRSSGRETVARIVDRREAPFLSAPRAVTKVRLLPVDPFPNAALIGWDVKCPLLILHGTDDSVIPFEQGAELSRLATQRGRCPSCRFIPVKGADHTDLAGVMGLDAYLKLVADFAESSAPVSYRRQHNAPRPEAPRQDGNAVR